MNFMCKKFGKKKKNALERDKDIIRFGHYKGWFRMIGNEN